MSHIKQTILISIYYPWLIGAINIFLWVLQHLEIKPHFGFIQFVAILNRHVSFITTVCRRVHWCRDVRVLVGRAVCMRHTRVGSRDVWRHNAGLMSKGVTSTRALSSVQHEFQAEKVSVSHWEKYKLVVLTVSLRVKWLTIEWFDLLSIDQYWFYRLYDLLDLLQVDVNR
jgi:hypothetical protein